MDLTPIIAIVAVIVIVYFFVKFIVSPLLKIITGIIIFVVVIYVLQQYFNINFNQLPFGQYLNFNKWLSSFDWIVKIITTQWNFLKKLIS